MKYKHTWIHYTTPLNISKNNPLNKAAAKDSKGWQLKRVDGVKRSHFVTDVGKIACSRRHYDVGNEASNWIVWVSSISIVNSFVFFHYKIMKIISYIDQSC